MASGNKFEVPFAQECFEVTPAAGELFVHMSQMLDKSWKELLFQVSQQYKTERPVKAPKSLEPESREDFPGFTEVQFMQSLKGSWELQMRVNLLLVIVKGVDESHKFGAPTFFLLLLLLLLATCNFVYTVVSQKSTHTL